MGFCETKFKSKNECLGKVLYYNYSNGLMLKRTYTVEPRTSLILSRVHIVPVVIASSTYQTAYDADSENTV